MSTLVKRVEALRLNTQNATKRAIEAERILEARKQELKEKDEKLRQLQDKYDNLRQISALLKDLAKTRTKTEEALKKYEIAEDKCQKFEARVQKAQMAIDDYEEKYLTVKKKQNDLVEELERLSFY
ncbi:hypothetical protein BJ165DRAFT_1438802 [Panaeolus papilionaceus]|nr:hypothetical protein BJ165DRAFT_1438802 [Panaeolus papilionaceus]